MTLRSTRTALAALGLALVAAGCQEQLTAPGTCPATCPGGTPVLRDTVLDALVGQDDIYTGYLPRGATVGVRVANGIDGHTDYALVRFGARADSVPTRDTANPRTDYTIDSVAITVTVLARDTTASGVVLELHRVPADVDTLTTFGDIAPLIVPGTLIDSVTIADSIRATAVAGFTYRFVFQGDTLSQVDIPAADSGVFAMAVAISGGTATGLRLAGAASGGVPLMRTYVTANTTDTTPTVKHQVVQSRPTMVTFVSSAAAPAPDSTILAIGTATAARAYLRFPWPPYLRDTALLARATLELVPEVPFGGLSGDSAFVDVHGVRLDFGAKSTVINAGFREDVRFMPIGSADTLRIDVINTVKLWQADQLPLAPLLVAMVAPTGESFTEPRFYSTRSPVAARRPRLRITYQLPFDFERP